MLKILRVIIHSKIQEKVQFVEEVYSICKEYLNKRDVLEKMTMEELKKILEKIEQDVNWEEYNIEGENLEEKIDFIVNSIPQLQMTLQQTIRMKAFERKK